MNQQTVNLILTALVFAFLIAGFLWGFIRGLKKSAFRGIWLILTLIVALFISQPIAKLVVNINISSLNINIDGQTASTIGQAIQLYATEFIGEDVLTGVPALSQLINGLPIMIVSPVMFALIFWALKITLWPIWAIIAHIVFKQKSKKVTAEKAYVNINNKPVYVAKSAEDKKPNKHRWYGSLVGVVCGLIVCCATFVPVFGYMNILEEVDNMQVTVKTEDTSSESSSTFVLTSETNSNTENSSTKTMSMLEYLSKDAYPYLTIIKDNVGLTTLKITGVKALGLAQFNYLSSTKVNNTTVSLGEDVSTILSVGQDIINISSTDFNHLTKESLNTVLTAGQNIIKTFKDVRLISTIGTDSLNYFCDNALNNPDFFVKLDDITDEQIRALVKAALEIGKDYTYSQLLDDAINLVETAKVANNSNLIIPVINNEVKTNNADSIKNYINGISSNFADEISKSIFKINIVNKMAYTLIDTMMEKLTQSIDVAYEKPVKCENSIIYENYFKKLISNSLNIISSLDFNDKYYVTNQTFKHLGKLINDIDSYSQLEDDTTQTKYYVITPTTFNNIINKFESNINAEIKTTNDTELTSALEPIIDNLSQITDFETEFTLYGDAYEILKPYITAIDNKSTREEISKMSLANLGLAINKLNQSTLINNKFYKIYNYAINKYVANMKINETSLSNLASKLLIDENNSNIDFNLQLKNADELFSQVVLLTDNLTADKITDSNTLKELGTNLQLIKERNVNVPSSQALLLKIDDLVVEFLQIGSTLTDNEDVKNVMLDLKSEIENTTDKSTINYKTEFAHIANVKDILDSETIELKNIVDTIDVIVNGNEEIPASTLLPKALFNALINHLPTGNEYNNAIKNILSNANSNATKIKNGEITISNYVDEMNALIKLVRIMDSVNDINIDDSNIDQTITSLSLDIEYIISKTHLFTNLKFETISFVFDEVINGLDSSEDADLINILNQAKQDAITNSSTTLKQVYDDINNIKDNFIDSNYSESELENDNTITQINNNLKEIANSNSFTFKTSNSVMTAILNNINQTIQNINSSEYPLIETEIETYKTQFNDFITAKLMLLPNNINAINSDEYKNILLDVKQKLLTKPTI